MAAARQATSRKTLTNSRSFAACDDGWTAVRLTSAARPRPLGSPSDHLPSSENTGRRIPPRPSFDLELTMPTTWNPLSLSHPEPSPSQPRGVHRIPTVWRLIYETLAEAQAMSREARRRYPFIGS